MKAIRTEYNGILFRSKLEAEWAKFFDSFKIPWIYEAEGFEFRDGTRYLPDFYLPDAHQWFEVKGIMNNIDLHKIEMLGTESKKDVIVGYPDGDAQMLDVGWFDGSNDTIEWDNPFLNFCSECGKYSFMTWWGSYECRCCGAYDGDHLVNCQWEVDKWSDVDKIEWRKRSKIDVKKNTHNQNFSNVTDWF